jgi:hypothetical protein
VNNPEVPLEPRPNPAISSQMLKMRMTTDRLTKLEPNTYGQDYDAQSAPSAVADPPINTGGAVRRGRLENK